MRYTVWAIFIFAVIFHAALLFPELTAFSPELNDNAMHYSLCVSLQEELESGGSPLDHWVPYWSMGFPVFHHYQHLPHLAVVGAYNLLFRQVPLFAVFRAFNYFLLVLFPLILYFSLLKVDFGRLEAAAAALFSLALSNINGYGFELSSFAWRGSGMFTQLWAMALLPPTLSAIYNSLKTGKNYFLSSLLLFLLTISQVMFGLIALITSLLFVVKNFEPGAIWARTKSLLIIILFFLAAASYFLLPLIIDSPYHAHSPYDFAEKWDSYGMKYVVTHFFNGDLLDSGRLPIATLLAVFGFLIALIKNEYGYRWAAYGFLLWFLLYFGRPTWGPLIDLIPLSSALHLHRLITMVHFFSAILAGIALVEAFKFVRDKSNLTLAIALTLLVLSPVFWERFQYLKLNNDWLIANKTGYQREKKDFEEILHYIKSAPAGRVYPGLRAGWGNNFKIDQTAVFYLLAPDKIPALSYLPFSWSLAGDFMVNFNENRPGHFGLFNVKYILADANRKFPAFARPLKQAGRFRLYGVGTSGYFDLVESPIALYGDKHSVWAAQLLWLRSPLIENKQFLSIFFDRNHHQGYAEYYTMKDKWVFWKPANELRGFQKLESIYSLASKFDSYKPAKLSLGKIISEETGKNAFSCRIRADKDCFLLFKMTFHPGWQVLVDGTEREKVMLTPGFIGVKVVRGEHAVKFVYRAPDWKTPLFFAGLLLMSGLLVWERRKV